MPQFDTASDLYDRHAANYQRALRALFGPYEPTLTHKPPAGYISSPTLQ
jgi:hypothetical protein